MNRWIAVPTKEMLDALHYRLWEGAEPPTEVEYALYREAYKAMQAAAPTGEGERAEDDPFCWYIVQRDITDEYVTVYSEAENCPGPNWKPLYEQPAAPSQEGGAGGHDEIEFWQCESCGQTFSEECIDHERAHYGCNSQPTCYRCGPVSRRLSGAGTRAPTNAAGQELPAEAEARVATDCGETGHSDSPRSPVPATPAKSERRVLPSAQQPVPAAPPQEAPSAAWCWWDAGPDGGYRVGPRDKGAVVMVFTIEEAQTLCKEANVLLSRAEKAERERDEARHTLEKASENLIHRAERAEQRANHAYPYPDAEDWTVEELAKAYCELRKDHAELARLRGIDQRYGDEQQQRAEGLQMARDTLGRIADYSDHTGAARAFSNVKDMALAACRVIDAALDTKGDGT